MRERRAMRVALLVLACGAIAVALLAGCARTGPPPIDPQASCAGCGMEASDARFACETRMPAGATGGARGPAWRVYDSIECLLHDRAGHLAPRETWLADYDAKTLHRADSLWVVHGTFPSPMGGGYAAFRDRAVADQVAKETLGRVGRLDQFERPATAPPSGATP